jgi:hypothetical protein
MTFAQRMDQLHRDRDEGHQETCAKIASERWGEAATPCTCAVRDQHLYEASHILGKIEVQHLGLPRLPAEQTTRCEPLPAKAADRKLVPLATGVLDYFPDALVAVAGVSYVGNEQHNPGQKLHWDRAKSTDEADCLARHFLQRGTRDNDGIRHSAKVAWRALALLQKEIEAEHGD